MAINNRGCEYADLWRIYKETDQYKAQILHWMALDKTLPILSYKTQLEVLDNAPMPIIKAHAHLLHDRTKKVLGLDVQTKKTRVKELDWYGVLG